MLLLSLAMHLWTGIKVIVEDYVHVTAGRILLLNLILGVMMMLGAYAVYYIWAEVSVQLSCLPWQVLYKT